ncbi:nitrogen fixation protein NifM [Nitrogeniibacter mangrovi]|uniref:peptidylprolyl isomerase n=1 Tax=Nitrogeniibacter mangrovi TaxID=2016596 RepID=A0A6C1B9A1_9RHOO|nr:nitrogen fixation protein NifM [Nitrogeniibacter mangrovi]QID19549.1 nitrogen fixation protein NifM [Nitrogeniibacter mangrovi]
MIPAYTELKLAWGLFEKAPDALDTAQRQRVREVARRQADLERRVLATREAAGVVVPDRAMAAALADIRGRYATEDDFLADLQRLGLNVSDLNTALHRELRVETVLEKVAARAPAVTRVDAELYYRSHPEAFDRPEARRLRHILITSNTPAEQAAAQALLEAIRAEAPDATAFGDKALAHSHCPTAIQAGELGVVRRGQLFAELEPTAFALAEGELSAVTASPMGLHLIRCDEILPHGPIPFDEVAERLVGKLDERRRARAQQDWLRRLAEAGATTAMP